MSVHQEELPKTCPPPWVACLYWSLAVKKRGSTAWCNPSNRKESRQHGLALPGADLPAWLRYYEGPSEMCFGNGFLCLAMFSALLKAWQGERKDIPDSCGGSAACWQQSLRQFSSAEVSHRNKDRFVWDFVADFWKKDLGLMRCCRGKASMACWRLQTGWR